MIRELAMLQRIQVGIHRQPVPVSLVDLFQSYPLGQGPVRLVKHIDSMIVRREDILAARLGLDA